MEPIKILVPLLLLGFQFVTKLFVGREVQLQTAAEALCELPTSIGFLSTSFGILFLATFDDQKPGGIYLTLAVIIIAIIIVAFFRLTRSYYDLQDKRWVLVLAINMFLALGTLYFSTEQLLTRQILKAESAKSSKSQK